jgi:flavin reductase (DIM6/NTAB) family NADH-FMN oxidoreductase RutF
MLENNLHQIWEKVPFIFNKLPSPGILLVTGNSLENKNIMTIGWLEIGVVWSKPVISVMVRPSRYSYRFLEEYDEFTINIVGSKHNEALTLCGSKSGSFCNKFVESGLHAVESINVKTPSIREAELIIECKIIHKTDVVPKNLSDLITARYYPENDFHRIFTGSILHLKSII